MEHCRQDGKLERIFSQTPGEDPVTHQDLRYTYDKNGNITQILDYVSADPQTGDPLTQDFEYDALDRLTSAGAANGTQGNYSESYTYDATTGNLAIRVAHPTTMGRRAPTARRARWTRRTPW
jgi:predicted Abi (CAAX) family protease